MYTTFVEITQPFIEATLPKKNTSVLELIMFYDTRADNPRKAFRVLSCVIYNIMKNYFCIDYLDFRPKHLSEITVGSKMSSKYGDKRFHRILVIGIPNLLMDLMSCHGSLKNINYVVLFKCPKTMLEYYFSEGFNILECNVNDLAKLPNEVKQRIHAEETDNLDRVMINTITSAQTHLRTPW